MAPFVAVYDVSDVDHGHGGRAQAGPYDIMSDR